MTTLHSRFLPAVPGDGFVIGDRERLGPGLRRVTIEAFDHAVGELASGDDVDRAIHEARKAMKRLRSVLRLVRGEIGNKAYRVENAILRDTARLLAPARDGAVLVGAVAVLRESYSDYLRAEAFADLEDRLAERHRRRRRRVLEDPDLLPRVVSTLQAARARYAAWPAEDDPLDGIYGRRAIRHSFAAIAPGLGATYHRGRKEYRLARGRPTVEYLHQWRKRVKYLRHQTELLEPLWPEVMQGQARSLDRLGDLLGLDHDLAILLRLVADLPDLCPDPVERSLLAALVQQRRRELQAAAFVVGAKAYAEPVDRHLDRIESYWEAWSQPSLTGS